MKRILAIAMLMVGVVTLASAQDFRPIPHPPSKDSVVGALQAAGNFNTLISLIEVVGFFDPSASSDGQLTLLAPNDAAFAKLSGGELRTLKRSPERIRAFLKSHVIAGKLVCPPMNRDNGSKASANNYKNLARSPISILDNTVSILDNTTPAQSVDTKGSQAGILDNTKGPRAARFLRTNIAFSGGLIQEIDAALPLDNGVRSGVR